MTRTSSLFWLLCALPFLVLSGGCSPLAIAQVTDYEVIGESESDATSSTSDGAGESATDGTGDHTSDGSADGTGTSTGSTTSPTQGEQITAGPTPTPEIGEVVLTPSPILHNGPILVEVSAMNADGVELELESGALVQLDDAGGGAFQGEIPVMTGFDNGEHTATLRPWRDDLVGDDVPATYVVALPEPGGEKFWETGDLIGAGSVAALGVFPGGDLVELGTRQVDGEPRCFLRRRDKSGGWWEDDLLDLLGGDLCTAIDLKVSDEGTLYVLLERYINNSSRWWLGEIPAWGGPVKNLRLGGPGESAAALAVRPGAVAICGSSPTGEQDEIDAATWVLNDGLSWASQAFDYKPLEDDDPHVFEERIQDCSFRAGSLVLAGTLRGKHETDWDPVRDRHLRVEVTPDPEETRWTVASGEQAAQSGATAITIDDQGRLLTAGFSCDDACDDPQGDLRLYDAIDGLIWKAPLGAWPTKAFVPHDLEWSPAGYAVVATGGTVGEETSFLVRAYDPYKMDPVWTFSRADEQAMHMAQTLTVGFFGEVYAGGWGATGYPAVAYISG